MGDELGRMRRKVVVAARTALVRTALDHLPPRQDPDALIVPDPPLTRLSAGSGPASRPAEA